MIAGSELLLLEQDGDVVAAGRRVLVESWARATRAAGLRRQRVDCYAGDDGKLVRWYESAGFTRTEPFEVKGWPGQLLERRA